MKGLPSSIESTRVFVCVVALMTGARVVEAQSIAGQAFGEVSNLLRDSVRRLTEALVNELPEVATAVIVLVIFWGLATLARWLTRKAARFYPDPTARMLVSHLSYSLVWAIGFVVMLDALGIKLETIATALGLGGVAVGFALKDILSNLVSGILILAMRSFAIGDQIVIGETEGTVERIELRATKIRTYDGRLVLVPNGDVFTSRITNNTASPLRRTSVYVYLEYKEDIGRALATILETVKSVPGVTAMPPPSMRLREFTPAYAELEARFWTDSRRSNLMNTASAARVAIVRALRDANIQLPDPDRRVVTLAPQPQHSPRDMPVGVKRSA